MPSEPNVEHDADGEISRAYGTSPDGRKLELAITGTNPNQTATFTDGGAAFLTLTTTIEPLGIRDPVDPAWANRKLFVVDMRSPSCWLRYELIPGPLYASDAKDRPFAASKSIPWSGGWRVVDAAAGTLSSETKMFRLFRIDPAAISADPSAALTAHYLAGPVPQLSPEANLTAELARAYYFSSVFHPSIAVRSREANRIITNALWWCLAGEIAGIPGGPVGAVLGCVGGMVGSIGSDVNNLLSTATPSGGNSSTGVPGAISTPGAAPDQDPKKKVKTDGQ